MAQALRRLLVLWLLWGAKIPFSEASLYLDCKVALQKASTHPSQKTPLRLNNDAERLLISKTTWEQEQPRRRWISDPLEWRDRLHGNVRGMAVTMEELKSITTNGLDPRKAMRGRTFFGFGTAEPYLLMQANMRRTLEDGNPRLMVLIELTPEESKKLTVEDIAPASSTRNWIPPQGIKKIFAADLSNPEGSIPMIEIARNSDGP